MCYSTLFIKAVLPICEIFRTKTLNCLTIFKTKVFKFFFYFILELSLNNFKIFSHKILQIGKTTTLGIKKISNKLIVTWN